MVFIRFLPHMTLLLSDKWFKFTRFRWTHRWKVKFPHLPSIALNLLIPLDSFFFKFPSDFYSVKIAVRDFRRWSTRWLYIELPLPFLDSNYSFLAFDITFTIFLLFYICVVDKMISHRILMLTRRDVNLLTFFLQDTLSFFLKQIF